MTRKGPANASQKAGRVGRQTTPLRSVGTFALTFLLLIPATLWCYEQVLPGYQRSIASAANGLFALSGSTRQIREHAAGGWTSAEARPYPFAAGPPSYVNEQLESLFLSLAILPALILATPLPWRRRLALLGIGLATLWVVHGVAAFALVQTETCAQSSALCHWMRGNVIIGGQLFALGLWALLTWDFWLQLRAQFAVPATHPTQRT